MRRLLLLGGLVISMSVGGVIYITTHTDNGQWLVSFLESQEGTCNVARKCIDDCLEKHGNKPFEQWPSDTQERYRVAKRVLQENGE